MVSEEQDGVVGVPAERAVLAGVGAVVHVVGALRGRVVGAAASEKKKKLGTSEEKVSRHAEILEQVESLTFQKPGCLLQSGCWRPGGR